MSLMGRVSQIIPAHSLERHVLTADQYCYYQTKQDEFFHVMSPCIEIDVCIKPTMIDDN